MLLKMIVSLYMLYLIVKINYHKWMLITYTLNKKKGG